MKSNKKRLQASASRQNVRCPLCDGDKSVLFAEENSYRAVRCALCGLVYVNPRPSTNLIIDAVTTGIHAEVKGGKSAISRRVASKVNYYKRVLGAIAPELRSASSPISWLDVGAGYGEIVEAVSALAPPGSNVLGVEPMKPKAAYCRMRGLNVVEADISGAHGVFQYISLINVFSHLADVRECFEKVRERLEVGGVFIIETGNIGDLSSIDDVPTELDLPDHLIFAGEKHIRSFLDSVGFDIISVTAERRDTCINTLKNCIKRILGRNVRVTFPYTSGYRTLFIKAMIRRK